MDSTAPDAVRELPKYRCHKEVWALRIRSVTVREDGSGELSFEDDQYAPIVKDAAWMKAKEPHVGGYFVVYEDGYTSFSPAGPFEKGYTRIH